MNLLITGAFALSENQKNQLENMGHNMVFAQQEKEPLPCDYDWVQGVVCNGLFLYHDIEKFSSLKYIQLTSAGYDRVPMEYIEKNNIKIFNAGGVYSVPMAEFALWGVLDLYKNARFFENNQKAHIWEKNRNLKELYNKNILVVGCGNVGGTCARLFGALGCNVYGADILTKPSPLFEKIYSVTELNNALANADIVILTLPLTEETKGLFGESTFNAMKEGAVLVNISRGAIVNTNALEKALKTRLGGAVLDVFETEPLSENSNLWNMENVIITPHNSFVGEGNGQRLFSLIIKNLERA